jgi:hypothetical protein
MKTSFYLSGKPTKQGRTDRFESLKLHLFQYIAKNIYGRNLEGQFRQKSHDGLLHHKKIVICNLFTSSKINVEITNFLSTQQRFTSKPQYLFFYVTESDTASTRNPRHQFPT